jgi:hypothetical protein
MVIQNKEIFDKLLNQVLNQYISTKNAKSKIYNSLFDSFQEYYTLKDQEICIVINQLIHEYLLLKDRIEKENKKYSILFNPLAFFYIGETLHSQILAYLLNPYAEHGQGALFLKTFLNLLKIDVYENDHWIVTAETGRIDILLTRKDPHSVVIIENKSNYAGDQDNQLYRYWYQEIYMPNKKKSGSDAIKMISSNNNYKIVYLTPASWKLPSEQSLMKPIGEGYDATSPNRIPIKPEIWVFNNHLIGWLSNSIQIIDKENQRLREFIKQYIELWKN